MEGMTGCPFCRPAAEEMVLQGRLWYARWDRYPVSPGHLLLIPCRHVADLFDATEEEMIELPGAADVLSQEIWRYVPADQRQGVTGACR